MPTDTYSTRVSSIGNTQEILGHPNQQQLAAHKMCQKKTLSDIVKNQNSILESITSMTRQINEIF